MWAADKHTQGDVLNIWLNKFKIIYCLLFAYIKYLIN